MSQSVIALAMSNDPCGETNSLYCIRKLLMISTEHFSVTEKILSKLQKKNLEAVAVTELTVKIEWHICTVNCYCNLINLVYTL